MKKKTSDTTYREPLLDRIIPPRTITLPNGHTVKTMVKSQGGAHVCDSTYGDNRFC